MSFIKSKFTNIVNLVIFSFVIFGNSLYLFSSDEKLSLDLGAYLTGDLANFGDFNSALSGYLPSSELIFEPFLGDTLEDDFVKFQRKIYLVINKIQNRGEITKESIVDILSLQNAMPERMSSEPIDDSSAEPLNTYVEFWSLLKKSPALVLEFYDLFELFFELPIYQNLMDELSNFKDSILVNLASSEQYVFSSPLEKLEILRNFSPVLEKAGFLNETNYELFELIKFFINFDEVFFDLVDNYDTRIIGQNILFSHISLFSNVEFFFFESAFNKSNVSFPVWSLSYFFEEIDQVTKHRYFLKNSSLEILNFYKDFIEIFGSTDLLLQNAPQFVLSNLGGLRIQSSGFDNQLLASAHDLYSYLNLSVSLNLPTKKHREIYMGDFITNWIEKAFKYFDVSMLTSSGFTSRQVSEISYYLLILEFVPRNYRSQINSYETKNIFNKMITSMRYYLENKNVDSQFLREISLFFWSSINMLVPPVSVGSYRPVNTHINVDDIYIELSLAFSELLDKLSKYSDSEIQELISENSLAFRQIQYFYSQSLSNFELSLSNETNDLMSKISNFVNLHYSSSSSILNGIGSGVIADYLIPDTGIVVPFFDATHDTVYLPRAWSSFMEFNAVSPNSIAKIIEVQTLLKNYNLVYINPHYDGVKRNEVLLDIRSNINRSNSNTDEDESTSVLSCAENILSIN